MIQVDFGTLFFAKTPQIDNVGKRTVMIVQIVKMG